MGSFSKIFVCISNYSYFLYVIPIITDFSSFGVFAPLLRFGLTLLTADFLFYFVHRLLHLPKFYEWHKFHHRFTKPYPYSALYCSQIEAIFCDEFSTGAGVYLFGLTQMEGCLWFSFVALYVLTIHSTLRLPYFSGKDIMSIMENLSEIMDSLLIFLIESLEHIFNFLSKKSRNSIYFVF